jgi:hypothetical protein
MAIDSLRNFAYGVVQTAPSPPSSGTSLTLNTGHGARFPAAPFSISVWAFGVPSDPTNAEIVRVTAKTGDVLTIQRQQEGSAPRTILSGDQVAQAMTGKFITDLITDLHAYSDFVVNTLRVDMNAQDAAQKTYIDTAVAGTYLPRVYSAATAPAAALNTDAYDMMTFYSLAQPLNFANTLGTPHEGQSMYIRLADNGVAGQPLTWSGQYGSAINGVALPSSTTIFRTLQMAFRYNVAHAKWEMVAVVQS